MAHNKYHVMTRSNTGSLDNASRNSGYGSTRTTPQVLATTSESGQLGGSSMMGGLLGGWFQNRMAKKQREFEAQQSELAYQRSLPWNSESAAGTVTYDADTKQMLQELSPEMQKLMGNWLGISSQANQLLSDNLSNPFDAQNKIMQNFDNLNENKDRQDRQRLAEQNYAQGTGGGTQGYYAGLSLGEQVNNRRLQEQLAASGEVRANNTMFGNLDQTYGRGGMDISTMLSGQATEGRLLGQGSNLNTLQDATASRNYTDTKSNFLTQFMQDSMGRDRLYNQDGKVIQDQKDGFFSFLA